MDLLVLTDNFLKASILKAYEHLQCLIDPRCPEIGKEWLIP